MNPNPHQEELLKLLHQLSVMSDGDYSEVLMGTTKGEQWVKEAAALIAKQPFQLIKFLEIAHANGKEAAAKRLRRQAEDAAAQAVGLKQLITTRRI